ncbi:hypothetical protein BC628DRAFT_697349 [Trametes gibbosa]|nr:hypothetical protein BC628DRAFT_697349 [Trametes gibbosa]
MWHPRCMRAVYHGRIARCRFIPCDVPTGCHGCASQSAWARPRLVWQSASAHGSPLLGRAGHTTGQHLASGMEIKRTWRWYGVGQESHHGGRRRSTPPSMWASRASGRVCTRTGGATCLSRRVRVPRNTGAHDAVQPARVLRIREFTPGSQMCTSARQMCRKSEVP